MVELRLLGRFVVLVDGVEVPPAAFGGRKVRALLRVLAARRGGFVSHDALTEALWPARPPADPAANLGVLVNRARRALGDPAAVRTGDGGYALGATVVVDAEVFLDAVTAAREAAATGEHRLAARRYPEALRHWGGEPLAEDAYADWAAPLRDELARAHTGALEGAAAALLASGDAAGAVEPAAAALAGEPLRESAVLLLVEALAAAGDRAAALAAYAEFRRALAEELGLDPSPQAAELHTRVLRGEPVVRPARGTPPVREQFSGLAFVGRRTELATMAATVDADPPGVAVVLGAAGAGKSRLLAELADRCPLPVLSARAFLPERAEAWGLARSVLREALAVDPDVARAVPARAATALADLVPELTDLTVPAGSAPLDLESRHALVRQGALRLLDAVAADGALLLVDDLQWADASSLGLLARALEQVPRLGCVLAYRPGELSDELLPGVLAELGGHRRMSTVELHPLSTTAIGELVDDASLAAALSQGTDRTPFAVVEVLRELAVRRVVAADPRGRWRVRAPGTVELAAELGRAGQRRAVRARVAQHPGLATDVLGLLSVLARETPAGTLATATGSGEREVLGALTALAGAGLLRFGERGWAPAHDLVAETVVADLSPAGRGRLHGLVARALESSGEPADPAELARHQAGAGEAEAAAAAFGQAARRALDASADAEAGELAAAGLALQPRAAARAELLAVRAETRARQGELDAARADLREALRQAPDGPPRSRLLSRLAALSAGSQDLVRAAELAELALVAAGADETARAQALEVAAILDMNLEQPERARERASAALALYQRGGDARGSARILDGRAMAIFLAGDVRGGVAVFGRVADLFIDSGDLLRAVTPRSTRGHGLVFLARSAEALADTHAALDLARALGHPEGQAYALWHRAEALSAVGRSAEAEADAREALALAARVGHRGWTATSLRALGIALSGQDRLDEAADAFARSLQTAEHLSLFASWAAARLALVHVHCGHLSEAEPLVAAALAHGPPLAHYEARLARVELAAARDEDGTPALAADALTRAEAGGHLVSVPRLTALSHPSPNAPLR